MSLIKCPECGKEISSMAETCPHCGYPIHKNPSTNSSNNNPFSNNSSSYQSEPPVENKQPQRRGGLGRSNPVFNTKANSFPAWTKKWERRGKNIRAICITIDILLTIPFLFLYLYTHNYVFLIVLVVVTVILFIPAAFVRSIRTEIRQSGGNVILVHSAFFKYLVVDEEILCKTTSKTLSGYLPDGKRVTAVISGRRKPVKIEIDDTEDEIPDFE